MTGHDGYTTRQAAYDLRKLRGKNSSSSRAGHAATTSRPKRPGPSPRCSPSATTSSRPILAGVRSPRRGRKPAHWTAIDRDYETLRIGMQTLFQHLGIETLPAAA